MLDNLTNSTMNDNASISSHDRSYSGFTTYSAGTSYTFHTVAESSVAQVFGSNKIKFHGRRKELDILHGIYSDVCGRHRDRDSEAQGNANASNANCNNSNTNSNKGSVSDFHLQQEIQIPDSQSVASKSSVSTSTPSAMRKVALVSGVSGSGKSAVVRQFIKELRTKPDTTSEGEGEQTEDPGRVIEKPKSSSNHTRRLSSKYSSRNRETREPLFLAGKFDELAGTDPFSAMVEAFGGLSSLLLEGRIARYGDADEDDKDSEKNGYEEDLARIKRDVRTYLRSEDVTVLTSIFPALKRILVDKTKPPSPINSPKFKRKYGSNGKETMERMTIIENEIKQTEDNEVATPQNLTANSWNRLKYVLQLFTRTISTEDRPVILLLDDLQWADNASLELVQALVTDKRIRHFMFIGTYRADEVSDHHPLSQKLSRISKTQPVESISIKNLTVEELIDFLHDHIKIDAFDCRNLATKVHAATNGNLFFVIQILVELNRQCALIYSEFRKAWEWDDVAGMLVLETGLSDNLEEAVELKIRRSPKMIKQALVTMAYSRGTIDIEILHKLMEREDRSARKRRTIDINQLRRALDRAVLEGFLSNSIGSNYYSFAHDKVLERSYCLIKEGRQREKFRLTMGRRLYKIGKSDAGETWMLFAAAEHLNSMLSLTDKDPLFLARMNLDIGERASKVSAYDQASKCLMVGLEALLLMPDHDPWDEEYDLTLRLHRTIADVELCRGNFETGHEIGRRVLEKARCLNDMIPTYESLALALGREELHAEALEMNREAMILLGEYPKRMRILVLVKELLTIRRYLKQTSDSDMMKLSKMTDSSKETALIFARGMAIQGFYCDNHIEFLLGTVRALRITFQYGLSGYTSMSILAYGLIQSTLKDHAGALRGVRLARNILNKVDNKSQESVFLFCAAYFTEAWVDSHEKTLAAYRQGHFSGMESGDVESAFLNSFAAVHHAQCAGSPLGSIGAITRELLLQLDMYNVKSVSVMMEQVYLILQYMTGSIKFSDPPWEELAVEPSGDRRTRTGSENLRRLHWYIARLELGVYFGNYEFADEMASELNKVLPRHPAYNTRCFRLFYASLTAAGLARKMSKAGKRMKARKYRKKAKKLAATLGKYNRSHGPNSYHRELLLRAELKMLDENQKKVSYDTAINACLEVNHIHDAALGSELAGEYYLFHSGDHKKGSLAHKTNKKLIRRHFTRARDLYHGWGAYAKVEQLQRKHGDYIDERNAHENDGIVSINIGNGFSSDMDDSVHSSVNGFVSKASNSPVLYNPRLLDLLADIVPSSKTADVSPIGDKPLGDGSILGDNVSVVSDIDSVM